MNDLLTILADVRVLIVLSNRPRSQYYGRSPATMRLWNWLYHLFCKDTLYSDTRSSLYTVEDRPARSALFLLDEFIEYGILWSRYQTGGEAYDKILPYLSVILLLSERKFIEYPATNNQRTCTETPTKRKRSPHLKWEWDAPWASAATATPGRSSR